MMCLAGDPSSCELISGCHSESNCAKLLMADRGLQPGPLRGGALAMLSRHFKEIYWQCDHKDAAGLATVFFCSA